MLQGQGVAQCERNASDQDQRGRVIRDRLRAQLFTDQQARQIAGQLGGAQAFKQAQRAHGKQVVQHTASLLALVNALQKSRFVKRTLQVQRLAQNRVLAHQGKHLAGHEGLELRDATALHLDPFAVCAREHQRGAVAASQLQGPENLHLFTAHHVRRVQRVSTQAAQAWHQRDAPGLQPQQVFSKFGKACGTGAVGRFLPALAAAGHARDQAQRMGLLHPVAKQLLEDGFKLTGGHREDAPWKFA